MADATIDCEVVKCKYNGIGGECWCDEVHINANGECACKNAW